MAFHPVKEKDSEKLLPWIKPCVTRLYWSAMATVDGYEGLSISKITLDRKEINWVVNQS